MEPHMQPLVPLDIYTQVVEEIYAQQPTAWPVGGLKLVLLLSSMGIADAQRYTDMASNILNQLPEEHRLKFLDTYAIPGAVLVGMTNPPAWPDIRETEQFLDFDEEDLTKYRQMLEGQVDWALDCHSRKYLRASGFSAVSYLLKREEALASDGDTPHIDAEVEATGDTHAVVAARILEKSTLWAIKSAHLASAQQVFQSVVRDPEATREDMAAIYDATISTFNTIMET